MKSVKTKSDLNALALSSGATVADEGGRKFNESRTEAKSPKRLEKDPNARQLPRAPKPAPPPPKPTGPDQGAILVAEKIVEGTNKTVMILAELKKQMTEIQMQSRELITDWDFSFIRDDKGVLTNLRAHGTAPVRVLN